MSYEFIIITNSVKKGPNVNRYHCVSVWKKEKLEAFFLNEAKLKAISLWPIAAVIHSNV